MLLSMPRTVGRTARHDTGIGVPAQDIQRLFEDNFRAKHAKQSEIASTGLGPAIVKRSMASIGAAPRL
ncbi:MAG: ATP-binding protein [Polyangiaceae bacterium]|nr:ATP-binding protein [Polyangiaceae bacterium]